MLKDALAARIPVISVNTNDVVHIERVLRHVTERIPSLSTTLPQKFTEETRRIDPRTVWYCVDKLPERKSPGEYARWFYDQVATLVVANVPNCSVAYDAGVLPTPRDLVYEQLCPTETEYEFEEAESLLDALGGLTLTEVKWATSLAAAKYREVTAKSVTAVRREAFPAHKGLAPVDLDLTGYCPPNVLEEWLRVQANFFHNTPDHRLRPRGLLFLGAPGTGKTMGAKFLADRLGVPLFRLAFEEVKNKYVGESEKHLTQALAQASYTAPCVLLLDEVEKLMGAYGSDSSGVTADLLATLLWWLQEHRDKVLTIMTTNDIASVPPELRRPGRIDESVEFIGVTSEEAAKLAKAVSKTFTCASLTNRETVKTVSGLFSDGTVTRVPEASVVDAVIRSVRAKLTGKPRRHRGRKHE